MLERPSLSNGYLWACRVAVSESWVRLLQQGLDDIRHELRVWEVNGMRDPSPNRVVELWVHPDDDARAGVLLDRLSAEQ